MENNVSSTAGTSISIVTPSPKYYWVHYKLPSTATTSTCISIHPFHFIYNKNLDPVIQKWAKIELLNWKEISYDEFCIWNILYPIASGENELSIYEDEGVHKMD